MKYILYFYDKNNKRNEIAEIDVNDKKVVTIKVLDNKYDKNKIIEYLKSFNQKTLYDNINYLYNYASNAYIGLSKIG